MEDRIQKAVELFKSGYNCSQSVVAAFADMYGFTQEQALRMAASFGGGIGRMRETCGAACGMFLVAGLETGATEAADREGKAANYAVVQELAAEFKRRNGSLVCGELLGLRKKDPISAVPEERTAQYIASALVRKWWKRRRESGRNISKNILNEGKNAFFITKSVKKHSIKCSIT